MSLGIAVYGKALEKFAQADLDWMTMDIKAMVVDIEQYGAAITAATNATPIVVTSAGHGIPAGQTRRVLISQVGGNTAANGHFEALGIDANTFSLRDPYTGANVAGSGAYTSGGWLVFLDEDEFVGDVPSGARGVVSANLSNKAVTRGGLYGDTTVTNQITLPSVANLFKVGLILFFRDTTVVGTSELIAASTEVTNLPSVGNGANMTYVISGGAIARL